MGRTPPADRGSENDGRIIGLARDRAEERARRVPMSTVRRRTAGALRGVAKQWLQAVSYATRSPVAGPSPAAVLTADRTEESESVCCRFERVFCRICRWTACCSGWSISSTPTSRSPSTSTADKSSRRTCSTDLDSAIAACRETYRLTISRLQRRHRGRGRAVLRAVCRLLPAGQGHEGRLADRPGRRIGHALQRRNRAPAADWWPSPRARACWWASRPRPARITQDPDTAVVLCDNVKGLGHDARPQPLHLRSARRRQLRPGDEVRLQRPPARHDQRQAASARRPGRSRIQPPDHAAGQASSTTGPWWSTSPRWKTWTTPPRCARCGCCWRACCRSCLLAAALHARHARVPAVSWHSPGRH